MDDSRGTDLQLERTNVYHDEATNRVAWVQGHFAEAELIDSALDVVRMMRDRIMEHRLARRQDGEGLHLPSFDLLHHLRASPWEPVPRCGTHSPNNQARGPLDDDAECLGADEVHVD